MINDILHMAFVFFIVMDSLGNIPVFISILRDYTPQQQRKIILRELIIALIVMVIFVFLGKKFLELLKISEFSVSVTGGIILFLIAIKMIFATPKTGETETPKDPVIVPLAVPAVAGPAVLATIIIYSGSHYNSFVILLAIFIAWIFSLPILLGAAFLKQILGENGLTAVERLFGYIIVLISTQMTINGLSFYFL